MRDTVFSVSDVLKMLAAEGSAERVIARAGQLESQDIQECLRFAADRLDVPVTVAVPLAWKVALILAVASSIFLLWVLSSPGAPGWVTVIAGLGSLLAVGSVVTTSYPLHTRRPRA